MVDGDVDGLNLGVVLCDVTLYTGRRCPECVRQAYQASEETQVGPETRCHDRLKQLFYRLSKLFRVERFWGHLGASVTRITSRIDASLESSPRAQFRQSSASEMQSVRALSFFKRGDR